MKTLCSILYVLVAVGGVTATGPAGAGELLYVQEGSTTLPSTDTGYDYIKMQPGTSRLFMARLADGLTVFDVDTQTVIKTVENSRGANGPLLLPEYGRGYVAMNDGSLLTLDLGTLEPISRVALAADGGLNSAIYDPIPDRCMPSSEVDRSTRPGSRSMRRRAVC